MAVVVSVFACLPMPLSLMCFGAVCVILTVDTSPERFAFDSVFYAHQHLSLCVCLCVGVCVSVCLCVCVSVFLCVCI